MLHLFIPLWDFKIFLFFNTVYHFTLLFWKEKKINTVIRRKSFVKESAGWSFPFPCDSETLQVHFQLPWIEAPKGEHAFCVLSVGVGKEPHASTVSQTETTLPPCLLSCLILFLRVGNTKYHSFLILSVSSYQVCADREMKTPTTITPSTSHTEGFFLFYCVD